MLSQNNDATIDSLSGLSTNGDTFSESAPPVPAGVSAWQFRDSVPGNASSSVTLGDAPRDAAPQFDANATMDSRAGGLAAEPKKSGPSETIAATLAGLSTPKSSQDQTIDIGGSKSAGPDETIQDRVLRGDAPKPDLGATIDVGGGGRGLGAAGIDETIAGFARDKSSDATIDSSDSSPGSATGSQFSFRSQAYQPSGEIDGLADYEIIKELGRGGMGVVFKARQRRLNRMVAIKMIKGGYADDAQLARFRIEAEAVAQLKHPNILQIYEISESKGNPFVALELLEGGSLDDKMQGTPLPPAKAAEMMIPLVLAMEAAHKEGIVHRDLKPANILFSKDGIPKITDFGLAKRLEDENGQTQSGQIMGTPSYMSPEQARGNTKDVGPEADIYALGTILYEMLTGRTPFCGATAIETVKQVIEFEPVSPSRLQFRIPRDLETICLKCLQKEPRKRYPTAQALADDLTRFLHGEPIQGRRTPPLERAWKWAKRHPTTTSLGTLALLAMFSGIAGGLWYWDHLRTLERIEERAIAASREETTNDLARSQEALTRNDLSEAQLILSQRVALLNALKNKPKLNDLAERAKTELDRVEKALAQKDLTAQDRTRYANFLELRKRAIFLDTQFTGLSLPVNYGQTTKAAEAALEVYFKREQPNLWSWKPADLPATLTPAEQADIRESGYELLMVLAESVVGEDPKRGDDGLKILENADALRHAHSRVYHLRKAQYLGLKGDAPGQSRETEAAALIPPQTAFDHYLEGQQHYKRKEWGAAIRAFKTSLRLKSDSFWANCLLAICYIQTKGYEAAKMCLTACQRIEPDFEWIYLLRGFVSGQEGAQALRLIAANPAKADALKSEAAFAFAESDQDFRETTRLLQKQPNPELTYVLHVNRGLTYYIRDDLEAATNDFQEAIRLKPDSFQAYAELAAVYQKSKKTKEAIEQFSRAIALKPDSSPIYRGRADLYLAGAPTPAQRALALVDLNAAITHETPGNSVLAQDHTRRATLLYSDEKLTEALKDCEQALKILSDYEDAHRLRIRILLKFRRYDEVIQSCDVVIAKGKPSSQIYELRGLAHAGQNKLTEALQDYTRALELNPDDTRIHINRGWAYLVSDAAKLAFDDFDKAAKLSPNESDAYNGRGTARIRLGDYKLALTDADEAIRFGSTTPRVIYNAARIYSLAAPLAAADVGKFGRRATIAASGYQDKAIALIHDALEREQPAKRQEFWNGTIQMDPALSSIRKRLKFESAP